MTVREELIGLVRVLSDEDAEEMLDYARWLLRDEDDALTPEEYAQAERGREQIHRGEYVTLDELNRRLGR